MNNTQKAFLYKSLFLVTFLMCFGCKQSEDRNTDKKSQRDHVEINDSITIGDLFTIYKLPYAYDHTIIYNPDDEQWHLYGIIADNREFIHLTADSLTQTNWQKHESFTYKQQEIWAPHIIYDEGVYHMFYTSIGVPRQIRYATSKDFV